MLYIQSKTVLGLFQLILKAWHQLLLCPTGSLMRLYYSIGYVINFMAEWVGFEPTDAFTSLVFKTSTLNRSDITPLFVNIITLFHSAVNTLEQIFRIELKIKLYKSLVIPFNYICFEFSSMYLCMKSLIRLVPFLPLSWAALINAARISPLTLMFIFLSCFKLSIPLKILFPVVFLMCSFPVVFLFWHSSYLKLWDSLEEVCFCRGSLILQGGVNCHYTVILLEFPLT